MAAGTVPVGRDWLPTASAPDGAVLVPTPRRSLEPAAGARPASRLLLGLLLDAAALLGTSMTAVTVWAASSGLHPLVVRSGSMEPLIPTGAMVLVRQVPAAQVRVGDVVAVRRPDGVTVTHRVVSLTRSGPLAELVLKGDANRTVDPSPVTVAAAGELAWNVPLLGRVAAWTASARGGFVLGCVVTAVLAGLRRRPA